ncbi:MAG: DJ-1/PfpI family protein, partial [Puniceicoccales bacterium]
MAFDLMEKQYQLGMVLFEGFELLDVFGPLEFFGRFPERFAIRMVAENAGQLASAQGPVVVADTALGDIDKLDILLVPGGRGTRREVDNVALINDLRRIGREADIVGSICTGAGLLARTDR